MPSVASTSTLRSGWTSVRPAPGAVGSRACLAMLAGLSLTACRPRDDPPRATDGGPEIAGATRPSAEARMQPERRDPRPHARSHVLLGIDFSRPLRLPECARTYNSLDRPDRTCVYLGGRDHKPFKIEFRNGAVPDFLKRDNAAIATDDRGHPAMLRFGIADDPALQGKAVDAMLETFGPPTRVENAGDTPRLGTSKVGTWRHEDYVIEYFFTPTGGGVVQMETRRFHDAPPPPATGATGKAKW
ncbi:MAG TPA: hypothetical protein VLM17_02565 [Xanthomonadaceae bacterium]|nr:hypothetical protein [Xanthomonadaceae bacterium]